jgi:hypothetical protein
MSWLIYLWFISLVIEGIILVNKVFKNKVTLGLVTDIIMCLILNMYIYVEINIIWQDRKIMI